MIRSRFASTIGATALLLAALPTAPATAGEPLEPATCSGRMRMEVLSAKRVDRGTIEIETEYLNLSNLDARLGVYYGGANGHDTFVVDNSGETWPLQKSYQGGGKNVQGKMFQPDVKTKVTYRFRLVSGGAEATKVNLTNWIHLLSPTGTSLGGGFGGFCKLEVRGIPLEGA